MWHSAQCQVGVGVQCVPGHGVSCVLPCSTIITLTYLVALARQQLLQVQRSLALPRQLLLQAHAAGLAVRVALVNPDCVLVLGPCCARSP